MFNKILIANRGEKLLSELSAPAEIRHTQCGCLFQKRMPKAFMYSWQTRESVLERALPETVI